MGFLLRGGWGDDCFYIWFGNWNPSHHYWSPSGRMIWRMWGVENSHESLMVIREIEKDGLFDINRRILHRNRVLKGDKEVNTAKIQ